MNIISIIIITQIPILGASALFAAGSVVMGIAKSKEVRANDDEDGGHDDGDGEDGVQNRSQPDKIPNDVLGFCPAHHHQ